MIISLYIFVTGLIIGSFINALEYRIEQEKSIGGRSFCPSCKHQLAWYDLIPVFSWISLSGKCRYCKKAISVQYPVIELLTGMVFLLFSIKTFGYNSSILDYKIVNVLSLIVIFFIVFILILNLLYDFKTSYILSKYLYLGIIATIAFHLLNYGKFNFGFITYLYPYLLSAILPALFFFSLSYFSKERWMGYGDGELVLLMGLLLGFPNILVALYIAFISGSIIGVIRIIQNKSKLSSQIPFGPILIISAFVAFLLGGNITSLYVKLLLGG